MTRRGRPIEIRVACLALVAFLGCHVTPDEKYRLLSFFFDDVPRPGQVEPAEAPDALSRLAALDRLRAMRERVEYVSVHGPYAQKACDECHDSRYRHSSRLVVPKEELCWNCHDPADFPGEFVHPPMAAGECDGCHDAHRSGHPTLLVAEPAKICEQCHDENTFPEGAEHRTEQGEDCLSCHSPHAADREYMLIETAGPS